MSNRLGALLTFAALAITAACGRTTSPGPPSPTPQPTAPAARVYWSVEALTADGSLTKVEVAGSYEEMGRALGKWYRDQGRLPRPLTAPEQQTVRALLAFYRDVTPGIAQQLHGTYTAYDLRLDDLSHAIPVWDEEELSLELALPGDGFAHRYRLSLADFVARMDARE